MVFKNTHVDEFTSNKTFSRVDGKGGTPAKMYQSSYVNTSKQKGFQLHGEDVSKSSKRRQRLFLILFSEAAASFPIANYFCLL